MRTHRRTRTALFPISAIPLALLFALPGTADAQLIKKVKDTAKDAAEQEVLNQVDLLVRDKVKCVFSDFECIEGARNSGEDYVLTDSDGEVLVEVAIGGEPFRGESLGR